MTADKDRWIDVERLRWTRDCSASRGHAAAGQLSTQRGHRPAGAHGADALAQRRQAG